VRGAALSTVMAQTLESHPAPPDSAQEGLGSRLDAARSHGFMGKPGWPLGCERLFNVGSFTLLVDLSLARVSDTDLAAHQIANQLNLFALLR